MESSRKIANTLGIEFQKAVKVGGLWSNEAGTVENKTTRPRNQSYVKTRHEHIQVLQNPQTTDTVKYAL